MKNFLLAILLFQSIQSNSQDWDEYVPSKDTTKTFLKNFNVVGYVDGIRLDSIKAVYAEAYFYQNKYYFDYGLQDKRFRGSVVTDIKGKHLVWDRGSIAWMFNFFNYNGWDLVPIKNPNSDMSPSYLMKKK